MILSCFGSNLIVLSHKSKLLGSGLLGYWNFVASFQKFSLFQNAVISVAIFSAYQRAEAHDIWVQNEAKPFMYAVQIIICALHTAILCKWPVMPNTQKVANWQLFKTNMVFGTLPMIKLMYNYSGSNRVSLAWPLVRISQIFDITPLFCFPRNHIHGMTVGI